jgi:outer membrane cobalamin receptor
MSAWRPEGPQGCQALLPLLFPLRFSVTAKTEWGKFLMNSNPRARAMVSAAVAVALLGSLPVSGPAWSAAATEVADDEILEEVVVTGSRIRRRDTEANSPLVTVEADALESRAGLNIEAYLNQLPAFNPAATPETVNADVQISSINSVGIASISLRGFGANRSLVLVDGRRAVPVNALMVVDLNSIPSSMIRSVEIISGGASATYGADALGGVSHHRCGRQRRNPCFGAGWHEDRRWQGQHRVRCRVLRPQGLVRQES